MFLFCKQKTAYEMRISDWSSDVCSSDLIAEFMLGRQLGVFLEALGAHHAQHRAKDLFLVDLHRRLDVVEQAAAHEIAVLVALQLEPAAVDHQLGAFADAMVDIALHLGEMLFRRSEEHTSELPSLMRNSYAVFCLKKKT